MLRSCGGFRLRSSEADEIIPTAVDDQVRRSVQFLLDLTEAREMESASKTMGN